MSMQREPTQPIHPDFLEKLDPQYVQYHLDNFLYIPRMDEIPWNRDNYRKLSLPAASKPLPIASEKLYDLTHCSVRVFHPLGETPVEGRPVFVNYHGGVVFDSLSHVAVQL